MARVVRRRAPTTRRDRVRARLGSDVVGIDPSLNALGIAHRDFLGTLKPEGLTGPERLIHMREMVMAQIENVQPELVVIEDYAYAAGHQSHQLGELGGVLNVALWEGGFRYIRVNLTHIKIYATGNGNANKLKVVQATMKHFGVEVDDDNQSDAMWARAIGYALLNRPLLDLPKTHTRALEKIDWSV